MILDPRATQSLTSPPHARQPCPLHAWSNNIQAKTHLRCPTHATLGSHRDVATAVAAVGSNGSSVIRSAALTGSTEWHALHHSAVPGVCPSHIAPYKLTAGSAWRAPSRQACAALAVPHMSGLAPRPPRAPSPTTHLPRPTSPPLSPPTPEPASPDLTAPNPTPSTPDTSSASGRGHQAAPPQAQEAAAAIAPQPELLGAHPSALLQAMWPGYRQPGGWDIPVSARLPHNSSSSSSGGSASLDSLDGGDGAAARWRSRQLYSSVARDSSLLVAAMCSAPARGNGPTDILPQLTAWVSTLQTGVNGWWAPHSPPTGATSIAQPPTAVAGSAAAAGRKRSGKAARATAAAVGAQVKKARGRPAKDAAAAQAVPLAATSTNQDAAAPSTPAPASMAALLGVELGEAMAWATGTSTALPRTAPANSIASTTSPAAIEDLPLATLISSAAQVSLILDQIALEGGASAAAMPVPSLPEAGSKGTTTISASASSSSSNSGSEDRVEMLHRARQMVAQARSTTTTASPSQQATPPADSLTTPSTPTRASSSAAASKQLNALLIRTLQQFTQQGAAGVGGRRVGGKGSMVACRQVAAIVSEFGSDMRPACLAHAMMALSASIPTTGTANDAAVVGGAVSQLMRLSQWQIHDFSAAAAALLLRGVSGLPGPAVLPARVNNAQGPGSKKQGGLSLRAAAVSALVPPLLDRLNEQLAERSEQHAVRPSDLCGVLHALASMRAGPQVLRKQFVGRVCTALLPALQAYAGAGAARGSVRLRRVAATAAAQPSQQQSQVGPREVAAVGWALSRLAHQPSAKFMEVYARAATVAMPFLSPAQLLMVAHTLSAWQPASASRAAAAAQHITRSSGTPNHAPPASASPPSTSVQLPASVRMALGHEDRLGAGSWPPAPLLDAFGSGALGLLAVAGGDEQVVALVARLAACGWVPISSTWLDEVLSAVVEYKPSHNARELSVLLGAVAGMAANAAAAAGGARGKKTLLPQSRLVSQVTDALVAAFEREQVAAGNMAAPRGPSSMQAAALSHGLSLSRALGALSVLKGCEEAAHANTGVTPVASKAVAEYPIAAVVAAAAARLAACSGAEQMASLKDEPWMAVQAACALAELGVVDAMPRRAWQVLEGEIADAGGSMSSDVWARLVAALGYDSAMSASPQKARVAIGPALRAALLTHAG